MGLGFAATNRRVTVLVVDASAADVVTTTAPPPRGAFLWRFNDPIEPMTLGNMRENGMRTLAVSAGTRARPFIEL
jgi:hypothetical protein